MGTGGKKVERPMDYTFLKLGGLYEAILDVVVEACRRFGAEKANLVIGTAMFPPGRAITPEEIREVIREETGILPSDDDLRFLKAVSDAREMVIATGKHLREACHGR